MASSCMQAAYAWCCSLFAIVCYVAGKGSSAVFAEGLLGCPPAFQFFSGPQICWSVLMMDTSWKSRFVSCGVRGPWIAVRAPKNFRCCSNVLWLMEHVAFSIGISHARQMSADIGARTLQD